MELPIIINRTEQNHRMIRRLNKMRRDESKCSFKIKVGDQTIFAHRDILMGISQYFEAMLSHDTLECQTGEVRLQDVDYACVEMCINAIYGEYVAIPQDKWEDMLFVAQMMQLDNIFSAIEESLIEAVSVETFIESLKTAKLFQCMKLQLACERFAEKSFKKLIEMGIFNDVDAEFIITLLKSDDTNISEQEKLNFVIFWVKVDISRDSVMASLLETIDLKQIPVGYRRYLIEEEDLIKNDLQLIRIFMASIMDSVGVKSGGKSQYSVLIFDQVKTNLQLYDPDKMQLKDTALKRISIDGHYSVAILDGRIYMLGQDRSVRSLKWEDEKAVWQTNPNMLDYHGHSPPVVAAAGFLYVIGGSEKCSSDTVERYLPRKNEWECLSCRDRPISGAATLAFEDSICSIGGRINKSVIKTAEAFNIATKKWSFLSKMNERREGSSATVWKNAIVVAGGFRGSNPLRSVEQYHKDINQWTLLRSMKIPRGIFQLYSINDTLFAFGGRNDESAKGSAEKYNMKNRMWENIVLSDSTALMIYRTILIEE